LRIIEFGRNQHVNGLRVRNVRPIENVFENPYFCPNVGEMNLSAGISFGGFFKRDLSRRRKFQLVSPSRNEGFVGERMAHRHAVHIARKRRDAINSEVARACRKSRCFASSGATKEAPGKRRKRVGTSAFFAKSWLPPSS
jgi:hypothetical protein